MANFWTIAGMLVLIASTWVQLCLAGMRPTIELRCRLMQSSQILEGKLPWLLNLDRWKAWTNCIVRHAIVEQL